MKRLLAVALIVFLSISGESFAAPEPVVRGGVMIDRDTGRQFIPRGVNWPSFEYACVDGWGYSHESTGPAGVRAMKRWKINTVRIPLNQDCWLGEDRLPRGGSVAGYRRAVKRFVTNLNRQGIVAVLDLHWTGGRGLTATGLRATPDSRSIAFWRSAARAFKNNRSVMFDAFNEPYSRWNERTGRWAFKLSWKCWSSGGCNPPVSTESQPVGRRTYEAVGMRHLVGAIRGVGARQPVILSGADYANEMRGWLDHAPNDRQLVAGFHTYTVQRCSDSSCWDREIAPLKRRVPVLVTEVGQNDCGNHHVKSLVRWADRRNIGYLAWAWWAISEGCTNYALINSWNGSPHSAYGTFYRRHLRSR